MKKRANLSPAEREDVKRLYATGKFSMRKLAEHFRCGKSTIDRIVKEDQAVSVQKSVKRSTTRKAPTEKPVSTIPVPPVSNPGEHIPPLQFKNGKLEEINLDLYACRERGQYNVLPALHRLHLNLYDECEKLNQEQKEIASSMEADGLVSGILSTIAQLPPVIRQKLEREILNKESKVITFPKVENE